MLTHDRLQLLQASPVFRKIGPADLKPLAEMLVEERLAAGDYLFRWGDASDGIFVVARGELEVPSRRVLGPGALVGEYGMVNDVRSVDVRATADTLLLCLDYARFRAYLTRFPSALWVLFATAVERLIEAEADAFLTSG